MLRSVLVAAALCSCSAQFDDLQFDDGGGKNKIDTCANPLALAAKNMNAAALAKNRGNYCKMQANKKNFAGETLGYLTPWNSRGYEIAKRHPGKFTYLSPVWLQLRNDDVDLSVKVTGTHDIDGMWMESLKMMCEIEQGVVCPKILPRLAWELSTLTTAEAIAAAAREIVNKVYSVVVMGNNEHSPGVSFDGLVFEAPAHPALVPVVQELAQQLHDANKLLFVVVPPRVGGPGQDGAPGYTSSTYLKAVLPLVDRFSVMTYDYSASRGQPGPNSPARWLRSTVGAFASHVDKEHRPALLKKLLLGTPFYGYDNTDAVLGDQFAVALMRKDVRLKADKDSEEHFVTYQQGNQRHSVYYPTPWSISKRLETMQQLQTAGVAIWELGQGLDCFMDLF